MLPQLHFFHDNVHSAAAAADDFSVTIVRKPGVECGYPQCTWMWRMKFSRGGCMASAFHENLSSAQTNAARIVGYMRGTHDCIGSELGPDGRIIERRAPVKQNSLFDAVPA